MDVRSLIFIGAVRYRSWASSKVSSFQCNERLLCNEVEVCQERNKYVLGHKEMNEKRTPNLEKPGISSTCGELLGEKL